MNKHKFDVLIRNKLHQKEFRKTKKASLHLATMLFCKTVNLFYDYLIRFILINLEKEFEEILAMYNPLERFEASKYTE